MMTQRSFRYRPPEQRLHLDAYFTRERWLIDVGLDHAPAPEGGDWEPACGAGHICRALAERGRTVFASDIFDWGWPCLVQDFFAFRRAPDGVRRIITNPPFRRGVAEPFVRHAIDLMAPVGGTVMMLLSHDWCTAGSGRADLFSVGGPYDRVIVPTARPLWFDPAEQGTGARRTNRPMVNYDWYVWSPDGVGRHGAHVVVEIPAAVAAGRVPA
jgi:hypothetical protein